MALQKVTLIRYLVGSLENPYTHIPLYPLYSYPTTFIQLVHFVAFHRPEQTLFIIEAYFVEKASQLRRRLSKIYKKVPFKKTILSRGLAEAFWMFNRYDQKCSL